MCQPELPGKLHRAVCTLICFCFIQYHGKHDILFYRQTVHQIKVLKNETDLSSSDICQLILPEEFRVLFLEIQLSLCWHINQSQYFNQGRLSASGLPHNPHKFSFFHRQINTSQYTDIIRMLFPASCFGIITI